jgi:DNA-binding response OmpR family regulator
VVLLSAKAQLQDQLRGWRAGCSDYVTKPFSPADLGERLVSISSMSPDDRARHRERAIEALAGAA